MPSWWAVVGGVTGADTGAGAASGAGLAALGVAHLFCIVIATVVVAGRVAVVRAAGMAASNVLRIGALDIAVGRAVRATMVFRTRGWNRSALLDANWCTGFGANS